MCNQIQDVPSTLFWKTLCIKIFLNKSSYIPAKTVLIKLAIESRFSVSFTSNLSEMHHLLEQEAITSVLLKKAIQSYQIIHLG